MYATRMLKTKALMSRRRPGSLLAATGRPSFADTCEVKQASHHSCVKPYILFWLVEGEQVVGHCCACAF